MGKIFLTKDSLMTSAQGVDMSRVGVPSGEMKDETPSNKHQNGPRG